MSNPPQPVGFGSRQVGQFLQQRLGNAFGILLGVGKGRLALELLREWPLGVLYLVDPYIHFRRGYDRPENVDDVQHQRNYDNLRSSMMDAPGLQGRYSFAREFSFAMPGYWREKMEGPDPRAVIFDANPSYGAVRTDLRAWWPLLAHSGIMCGTNYSTLGDGTVVGTRKAVDEFAAEHGLQVYVSDEANEPWWFLSKG